MKIHKYIIFTTILFLFSTTSTYAACTQEEINGFKRIEDEYTVNYEFNNTNKTYTIYLHSTQPKKYYYQIYAEKKLECSPVDSTTVKCINFPSGDYDIEIIGMTETCNDVLKLTTLRLPKYNKLSEDPLCKGIEEFVLCNPTYSKEIDYETFVSRVNTYKKNHASDTKVEPTPNEEEEKPNEIVEKSKEVIAKITEYAKENWIEISIVAAFTILVIITLVVTVKSQRKSRYLE